MEGRKEGRGVFLVACCNKYIHLEITDFRAFGGGGWGGSTTDGDG